MVAQRQIPEDAHCFATDVSSGYAAFSIMGPKSRELLAGITRADLSNEAFPFATTQEIEIGYAKVRAVRVTYVGELGWELYISTEMALHVFEVVVDAGKSFGLIMAGMHVLDGCRIE